MAKCLDCVCGEKSEVRLCPDEDCPLWPFRLGKNPYSKRQYTDEQKVELASRLQAARAAKKNNESRD